MKVYHFLKVLIKSTLSNGLIQAANELTYKLLLSLFPFLIFLMTLLGFFNLDKGLLLENLAAVLPTEIFKVIQVFVIEVVNERHVSLLSFSLLVSIVSASSGFMAVIRGINKSYGEIEHRNFFVLRGISICLVLLFAFAIILTMMMLVFGTQILHLAATLVVITPLAYKLFSLLGFVITIVILLLTVMIIYKLASCKKIHLMSTLPGALTAIFFIIVSSKLFNVYINNFASFSKVYGSVASLFILMFWLNLVSALLLIGSQINAMLKVT